MHEPPPDRNEAMESALADAYNSKVGAEERFFKAFLRGPVFIPERRQKGLHPDNVQYPDDFINIFAAKSHETTVVPVFSSLEMLRNWAGRELAWRESSGEKLLLILPDNWHICVNPNGTVEKEITAWEIARLKHGEQGLREIVEEILDNEAVHSLQLRPLSNNNHIQLKLKLRQEARKQPEIVRLYLVEEISYGIADESTTTLLLGIAADKPTPAALDALQDHFQRILDINLIGEIRGKVLVGDPDRQSILLQIFQGFKPFYRRTALAHLMRFFSGVWKNSREKMRVELL